jgi:hypothetical protein
MWYPSQEQQQQYSWYGYIHHPSSQQQQQAYSRTSYYCNDDELSSTGVVAINDENDSPVHCKTTYDGNVHSKRKAIENFISFSFSFQRFSCIHENKTNHLYKCYNLFHFLGFIPLRT